MCTQYLIPIITSFICVRLRGRYMIPRVISPCSWGWGLFAPLTLICVTVHAVHYVIRYCCIRQVQSISCRAPHFVRQNLLFFKGLCSLHFPYMCMIFCAPGAVQLHRRLAGERLQFMASLIFPQFNLPAPRFVGERLALPRRVVL